MEIASVIRGHLRAILGDTDGNLPPSESDGFAAFGSKACLRLGDIASLMKRRLTQPRKGVSAELCGGTLWCIVLNWRLWGP